MKKILNIVKSIKSWWTEKNLRYRIKCAESVFQARELDGEIWLTVHGEPVIPQDMLNTELVSALSAMRKFYVARMMRG